MTDVVVLGGGPAGLYAGLLLTRRGMDVTILEKSDTPGGLAAGLMVDGVAVDHGSHRLHRSIAPDILADLQDILGDDLQERRRNGRIRLGDSWLRFPLSPTDLLTHLPVATTTRLGIGAVAALARRSDDNTFESVVATGLGRPMGNLFYFPYARKIWGVDPGSLSGEQARRRIAADSPLKLLRKTLTTSEGRTFLYPRKGFGQISHGLAGAARDAGADLRLGSAVVRLHREEKRWRVETEAGEDIEAPLVLSTVPMTLLVRMLQPPPNIKNALETLTSRAMILVYLTVDSDQWTTYDAHYFPGEDVIFTRISEPKNYRESPDDPDNTTVLCVEIPADRGDLLWSTSDDEIISRVRDDVIRSGLPSPGEKGMVRRLGYAYPIYRVGVERSLETVNRWLTASPWLLTFGRQGLFAHDNTHHTLGMARDAVASITASGDIDHRLWSAARRRFATHVVED